MVEMILVLSLFFCLYMSHMIIQSAMEFVFCNADRMHTAVTVAHNAIQEYRLGLKKSGSYVQGCFTIDITLLGRSVSFLSRQFSAQFVAVTIGWFDERAKKDNRIQLVSGLYNE